MGAPLSTLVEILVGGLTLFSDYIRGDDMSLVFFTASGEGLLGLLDLEEVT